MQVEHHDLHHDFPEFKEVIHNLKLSDHHFARRFDEYDALDKSIRRIEEGVEASDDKHLEALKMKRVHLKDELYTRMRKG